MNRKQIPNNKEFIRKGIAIPCGDAFVLLKQVTFRFYSFSLFKQADTAEGPQNGDGNIYKPKITHRIGEYDSKKTLLIPMIPFAAVIRKIEFMIPERYFRQSSIPRPKRERNIGNFVIVLTK
ncbi:MAG: hypothetical protein IJC59_06620 [Lachnospiraceae bacterium]|nr:hypothetical protein [Lachnospiraceae bacterium]